jgi:hypothetical protein
MGIVSAVATKQVWRQRVQAWRASRKRSDEFCEGRDFSAGLLRHWAWRLGLTRKRRRKEPAAAPHRHIQLARVVVPAPSRSSAGSRDGIEVQMGSARVHVRPGFDAETLTTTLTALLDVLEHRSAPQEQER